MKIELCSIWEGFDGSRFEVVDATKKSVVVRSVNDNRRIEVPAWKFTAGMLRNVEDGRKRLYAPSDVQIGKELWSLNYECEIKPESKSKRKNRYLCRITKPDTSVSYKHLTPRKICALLNTEVDHIVEGDLRPGVEFKNGIKVVKSDGRTVWFEARDGLTYDVSPISVFLTALNRGDRLISWVELRCTLAFAADGTPCYIGNRSSDGIEVFCQLGKEKASGRNVYVLCSKLNAKNREIRRQDLCAGVCVPLQKSGFLRIIKVSPNEVEFAPYSTLGNQVDGKLIAETKEFLDFVNGKRETILVKEV